MVEEKEVKASFKVIWNDAQSAFFLGDLPSDFRGGGISPDTIDKLKLPKDFNKIIDWCRFFYERDPIASTVCNKIVEIGVTSVINRRGECTDEEAIIFEFIKEPMYDILRSCALEYLLSGLVIVEADWDYVYGREISPDLKKNKKYYLPTNFWWRDPKTIVIKETPIPNRVAFYVKISDDDSYFISSKGKRRDGSVDKKTFKVLKQQYPKFVAAVQAGQTEFLLDDDIFEVRRNVTSKSPYPTPFLMAALEPMIHKRNIRKMDYSIAARVISAIQLIRLGSDDFPLTEDDEDVLEEVKKQMRWRNLPDRFERVFQLFGNHTLDITWVFPDTAALLDDTKYDSVNQDIVTALGFPRILIVGETLRTGAGSTEYALLGPTETMKDMRIQLLQYPKKIYKEIMEHNNFKTVPTPAFTPIHLQDIGKLGEVALNAFEHGVISKTTYGAFIGTDYLQEELPLKVEEEAREKELGIEPRPDVPFDKGPEGKGKIKKDDTKEETE